jgi:hypothetical protein
MLFNKFWQDFSAGLFSVMFILIGVIGLITIGISIQDSKIEQNCYAYHKELPYEIAVQTCDAILHNTKGN